MADKIITIRMNEGLQAIYEKRVAQVNKLAPESKLTIGGSVKYGAELFALDIAKAEVQQKLICPLTHLPVGETFSEKFKDNALVTEKDEHSFSYEDTKKLADAFEIIYNVFTNYEKMPEGAIDGWKYVMEHYKQDVRENDAIQQHIQEQSEWEEQYALSNQISDETIDQHIQEQDESEENSAYMGALQMLRKSKAEKEEI